MVWQQRRNLWRGAVQAPQSSELMSHLLETKGPNDEMFPPLANKCSSILQRQVHCAGGSTTETGVEPIGQGMPPQSQGTKATGKVMVQNCPSRRSGA